MAYADRSEEPFPVRIGQIMLLEETIRQEQIATEPLGLPTHRSFPTEATPEEKVAQLARYEAQVREVVTEEAFQQLGPSPAQAGMLWAEYTARLHKLKVVLRARREELARSRLGR